MAWIATEGNAFNHATDRVEDVAALTEAQKALGRPMKEALEVGSSGRVVQTAFRAAQVERPFVGHQGQFVLRTVPGSFYEFITRRPLPNGRLDLSFDSSNAQGIFKMTEAADGRQHWLNPWGTVERAEQPLFLNPACALELLASRLTPMVVYPTYTKWREGGPYAKHARTSRGYAGGDCGAIGVSRHQTRREWRYHLDSRHPK
jgi:hypothetical protein